jgi:hypothetical protein
VQCACDEHGRPELAWLCDVYAMFMRRPLSPLRQNSSDPLDFIRTRPAFPGNFFLEISTRWSRHSRSSLMVDASAGSASELAREGVADRMEIDMGLAGLAGLAAVAGDSASSPHRARASGGSSPGNGRDAAANTLADMMSVDRGAHHASLRTSALRESAMRASAPAMMHHGLAGCYEHTATYPHTVHPVAQPMQHGQPQAVAASPLSLGHPSARAPSQRGLVLHITEHTVHRIDELRRDSSAAPFAVRVPPQVDPRRTDASESQQRFAAAASSEHTEMVVSNLRLFSLSVALFDSWGARVTALPGGQEVLLRADLIYENGLRVEQLGTQEPPLVGKTELLSVQGQVSASPSPGTLIISLSCAPRPLQ